MFLSLTVVLKVFHTQSGRKKAHIVVPNSLSPSDTAKRNFSQARAVCLMLRNKQYKNVNFADVYYPCNISEFLTLCKVSHAAISRVRALIMLKITDWIRHWSELQWQDVDTKFRECRSPSLTVAHTHTWHDDLKSTHFFFLIRIYYFQPVFYRLGMSRGIYNVFSFTHLHYICSFLAALVV